MISNRWQWFYSGMRSAWSEAMIDDYDYNDYDYDNGDNDDHNFGNDDDEKGQ